MRMKNSSWSPKPWRRSPCRTPMAAGAPPPGK
jgi:hypothetical protein